MAKGYYGIDTLYLTKFKISAVSCERLLPKATDNSDSQNTILETTENSSTREVR